MTITKKIRKEKVGDQYYYYFDYHDSEKDFLNIAYLIVNNFQYELVEAVFGWDWDDFTFKKEEMIFKLYYDEYSELHLYLIHPNHVHYKKLRLLAYSVLDKMKNYGKTSIIYIIIIITKSKINSWSKELYKNVKGDSDKY